jgi:hypothetical protein
MIRLVPCLVLLNAAVAGCGLPASDPAPPAGQPLGPDRIEETLRDTTRSGEFDDGTEWAMYHAPNGELVAKSWGTRGVSTDEGRWFVSDTGEYCLEFEAREKVHRRCWKLYRVGGELVFRADPGERTAILEFKGTTLESGNIFGL